MNFSTPEAVGSVIETAKKAELLRAGNRVLINELFNGHPPYTDEEAEENGIHVNVNWKEATNYAWNARRQYNNAFLKPATFFQVRLNAGNPMRRREWGHLITQNINRVMKRSRTYMHLVKSKFAGVVLHGTGAQMWSDNHCWLPEFVAVEDLLIPSDVEVSFRNLAYFAIRREYTVGELFRKTHGEHVDPRWNMPAVRKILEELKDDTLNKEHYTWSDSPEKMAELFKQNLAYYESDKAPTIVLWEFYHQEDNTTGKGWFKKVLRDRSGPETISQQFLYDTKDKPFCSDLSRVLHVQFGDGNNKPPFLYHSVRSLGFLLYDVCQLSNRLRCQVTQHVFEQLMMLFRINDPADRDRAKKILLANNQVIESGIEIIPNDQRHQVDPRAIEILSAQFKQLMGESTSSYTQQADTGTSKEQTATETMAKVQQLNALMSSMLSDAYQEEVFGYQEICRRFCIKDSTDKDVEGFQVQCRKDGIPDEALDSDKWDVIPEQVLGGGNKMLEMSQANQLMAWRPLYGPEAQQEILHIATEAMTDDPKLAETLAPTKNVQHVTDTVHDAEISFGTLMQGIPISVKPGQNQIEVVETWLAMLDSIIQRIQSTDNMGTPQDVIGLNTVAKAIQARVNLIGQDPNEKACCRSYMQALGKLMNEVKAFAQRQQEARQQQQQAPDPEAIAKMQADQAAAQQKLAQKDDAHRQKLFHKDQTTLADQRRKDMEAQANIERQKAMTQAEVAGKLIQSTADARIAEKQAAEAPTPAE